MAHKPGLPLDYFFGPDGPGDCPPHDFEWHCHHHHHHDHCADECDDQLPAITNVGRGLQGNGFYITIDDPDTCTETYLQGWKEDSVTGETTMVWESENINGGELYYQYNLRPYTNPQTFTITFIYRRPTRCEWSWTTPAIPYVWDANKDGDPDVDGIIGSGVGDLYIRTAAMDHHETVDGKDPDDSKWIEKLVFPPGTTAKDYNSPQPLEPWSVNLTFGLQGGDVLVPNLYDLAKVLGFPAGNVFNITKGNKGELEDYDDIRDYIWNTGVVDLYIRNAVKDWSLDDPRFKAIWEKSSKSAFISKFGDPIDNKWNERLHFPPGKNHNSFPDLPEATEPWSSTITYGLESGDVLVPNIYDLMLLMGINPADYYNSDANSNPSNIAEMMKWSAYVQCAVVGQDTVEYTSDLHTHIDESFDFDVSDDGASYASRVIFTYKPFCKIMNARLNWWGNTGSRPVTIGGHKYYCAGSYQGRGFKSLPEWFRPNVDRSIPNYLIFSFWDPKDPANTFSSDYCNLGLTKDGQVYWEVYGGHTFTVPANYYWEIKSTQGIIFYDDWGIEKEVDSKGHPMSNVSKPGTTNARAIAALAATDNNDGYEVHYDFDRSLI